MTQETATVEATATRRPYNAGLRESQRDSAAGEGLSDFWGATDASGRSSGGWVRVHDRAIGVVIGIALAGVVWTAWAIIATQ